MVKGLSKNKEQIKHTDFVAPCLENKDEFVLENSPHTVKPSVSITNYNVGLSIIYQRHKKQVIGVN